MFTIKIEKYEDDKLVGHRVFETEYYETRRHADGKCEIVYMNVSDGRSVELEITTRAFIENARGHTIDMVAARRQNGSKK